MGPGVPSVAVFSFSSCPFGTCFIKPSAHSLGVSSSLLVLTSLADSFSVCLAPVASCDRVSIPRSKHTLPELTPTAVFDELLLVTVLMTPRATSHPPWHRRHGFPQSLAASPLASLHASPRPQHFTSRDSSLLAASPAFTCWAPPEWSAACITSLHSFLCATVGHCTFFRVLPHLHVLSVVCSPLSSLSRSAGPPARLSELTLPNTHLHVLRADWWCSSAALTPPHVARGVVEFMSPVFFPKSEN